MPSGRAVIHADRMKSKVKWSYAGRRGREMRAYENIDDAVSAAQRKLLAICMRIMLSRAGGGDSWLARRIKLVIYMIRDRLSAAK